MAKAVGNTYVTNEEYLSTFESARGHINSIGELLDLGAQQAVDESKAAKDKMIVTMIIIDAVVLVMIIFLSILVIRGNYRSAQEISLDASGYG